MLMDAIKHAARKGAVEGIKKAIREAKATARREALEEAARIAEEYAATLPFEYVTGKGVAAAIRAKIGEGQGNG